VQVAASKQRFLSSLLATDQFTVKIVTNKEGKKEDRGRGRFKLYATCTFPAIFITRNLSSKSFKIFK